jgi:hypothetical protein
MLRATRSALGAQSHVELREARDPASDAQALAAEQRAHADAVVEVTWAEGGHRQATLRVHLARGDRWVDRSIGFHASDADAERGRTIGFAVASMIPEASGGTSTEPEPPSPPVVTPPVPTGVLPTPPLAPLPSVIEPPPAVDRVVAPPPATRAAAARRPDVVAIDVVGLGAAGGDFDSLGAAASVHWFPASWLGLRLGGGARAGNVQAAQATTLTLLGSAGAVLYPLRASASHPFGVWIRADYVLEHPSLTHFSASTPSSSTQQRWMSGMDALVGVEWRFSSEVGVLAGIGGEDVFSSTYVQVSGVPVATLPPLRGVAEAGFRLGF